ncbi:hypothetical protein SAMN06265222_12077 [Neorhodopirellula lusitana]|uniref:Uncharacterized protein n=1 Tax=Neorhodopirellula lusitana TaxID=445327 RepID=A0ABY1QNU3_9BACT|nr:hypothetical protein SAMN06265222_12077 [Neorhodopirellula lusitana]
MVGNCLMHQSNSIRGSQIDLVVNMATAPAKIPRKPKTDLKSVRYESLRLKPVPFVSGTFSV